jgi:hypothetical protein
MRICGRGAPAGDADAAGGGGGAGGARGVGGRGGAGGAGGRGGIGGAGGRGGAGGARKRGMAATRVAPCLLPPWPMARARRLESGSTLESAVSFRCRFWAGPFQPFRGAGRFEAFLSGSPISPSPPAARALQAPRPPLSGELRLRAAAHLRALAYDEAARAGAHAIFFPRAPRAIRATCG